MRRNKRFFLLAGSVAASAFLRTTPACAADAPDKLVAELAQVRQQSIAAAREVQERQGTIQAIDREIDLMHRDLAARQRGLDESQTEQGQLLGALERLARHPEMASAEGEPPRSPLDHLRTEMLLAATIPALRAEAQALTGEIATMASLRARVAARATELAAAREALPEDRERLAQIVAHRAELLRQLLPEIDKAGPSPGKPETTDLDQLIEWADAAADRHDKALSDPARSGLAKGKPAAPTRVMADPTRPKELRSLAAAEGAVRLAAAATVLTEDQSEPGLHLLTAPAAVVVAPFDGQVVYAGPFHPYVLVLIIRHTDGYHSLIAGLGRADTAVGQWVLAGEPVGVTPEAAGPLGSELYVELRRDGGPVDPRPWLIKRDESTGRGDRNRD